MGAGAALFDYDNDGDLDVFLLQDQSLDAGAARSPPHASPLPQRARRAQDAALHRRHRPAAALAGTATAWASPPATTTTTAITDLYVTALGPEHALPQQRQRHVHRRDGGRRRRRPVAGARPPRSSTTTATATSICSSPTTSISRRTANKQCFDPAGTRDYCGPRSYRPVPDRLFRNEGGGRFTDVTDAAGIAQADGAGLGVAVRRLQRRRLAGPLRRQRRDAEPAVDQPEGRHVRRRRSAVRRRRSTRAGNPEGSMGVASGDYDGDGDEDLFVTNIIAETFALYTNDGRGGFDDARVAAGAGAADRRLHRLRHRLDRLRQRRLAGPVHRQRRGEHRRGAARPADAVPDAEPVVSQRGDRTVRRGRAGAGRARRSRGGGRPRRRVRRHRQRRRHRHPGDEQQRAGPAVAEPGRHRRRRGCRCGSTTAPAIGSGWARWCTSSVAGGRRWCVASAPMAAISPRRTRRRSLVWRVAGRGDGARGLARRRRRSDSPSRRLDGE